MRYGPVFIKDKFGRDVELRNAEVSDSAEMIKYLKTICGETPYVIRDPDEINLTLEQEQKILQNKIDSEDELLLVALVEDKHVGNCSLMSFGDLRRYRHRCSVAIALYQEYCGLGIGRQMMDTVLRAAKDLGYEQAELEVNSSNANAIALYESMGFVKYGTYPDSDKFADGTYGDSYWMMKKL